MQQHTTFDSFLNEKYKGSIMGHLKNAMGKRVPEMDKYAKLITAALGDLAKPTAFQVFAVEMHPNNVMTPKDNAYNRYQDAKKNSLKSLYKLVGEIDDMVETIKDVKVLTGVRTNVVSSLNTIKSRLEIADKDGVKLVTINDPQSNNYYAHWGFVGPDSTLATGQANIMQSLQHLKDIFEGNV